MNNILRAKIEHAQKAWEPTNLNCIRAGKLPEGIAVSLIKDTQGISLDYMNFLVLTNGAVCGCIVFVPFESFHEQKAMGENLEKESIFIGFVDDMPLILTRKGLVKVFDHNNAEIFCYGNFESFLNDWVFGEKYVSVVPLTLDKDPWYDFMVAIALY